MLDELKLSLAEKNIKFSYTDDAVNNIAKNSYSQKFGARNMRRYIQKNVEDMLAEAIISDYGKNIIGIVLKYSEEKQKLEIECLR